MPSICQQPPLILRKVKIDPPLMVAPMANLTHSALRRLLADFGGYGALFTEMLSAKMILNENFTRSPWLKRRPQEGRVFYQLMTDDIVKLPEIVDRLAPLAPDGLDLNCACGAATIRRQGGGAALFEDVARMQRVVAVLRRAFEGPLTVKIRLGRRGEGWRDRLWERIQVLEGEGVDAVILHPRFMEDKFKRVAQYAVLGELAARMRVPLIGNGDISGAADLRTRAASLKGVAGWMIGRHAVARPWICALGENPGTSVDEAEVARRFCAYLAEDFEPDKALRRLKVWMPYFARNYAFGHTLFAAIQSAPDWDVARSRLDVFCAARPERLESISVDGL
jgi:tRNA-dihydrouridine synthase B